MIDHRNGDVSHEGFQSISLGGLTVLPRLSGAQWGLPQCRVPDRRL